MIAWDLGDTRVRNSEKYWAGPKVRGLSDDGEGQGVREEDSLEKV